MDMPALVRTARAALAAPRCATLLVEGLGQLDAHDESVLLHDNDGRPTLLCADGSVVCTAAAARRPAVLRLGVPDALPSASDGGAAGTSVVYVGHLAPVGEEFVDGARVSVVELRLAAVMVENDDPALPSVAQHDIPLVRYGVTQAGALAATAEGIRSHTNAGHPERLRAFVAGREGRSPNSVADAHIAVLDEDGVELHWIDERGAHRRRIEFAHRAGTPQELAALLRCELTGADR